MTSKYVPPSLRNRDISIYANSTSTTNDTINTNVYNISLASTSMYHSVNSTSLVNTSLPAKEAPILIPATLASLTSSGDISSMNTSFKNMNLEQVSICKENSKKFTLTDDDFPILGKASTTSTIKPTINLTMNFAEKAREWAAKQKEDKRIAAEEAEKERIRISVERLQKEKAETEEKRYKKIIISLSSIKKTNELELEPYNDDEKYISDYDDNDDEQYESQLEEEEEEEEEDEEYQSHWDGRRYLH